MRALINTGYNICYTGFVITYLCIGCIPRNSSVCQNDVNGEWLKYSNFSYKYDILLGINNVNCLKAGGKFNCILCCKYWKSVIFHSRTLHLDIIKVLLPTNGHEKCFRKNIKIYIETAPTFFILITIIRGHIIRAC